MQPLRIPCEPWAPPPPSRAPGPAIFDPSKLTAHPPSPATCNPHTGGFAAPPGHRPPGPCATALALSRARSS